MHKTSVELIKENCELKDKIRDVESKVKDLEFKLKIAEEWEKVRVEKAKDELRREMQKSLIESDIKRVEAVAKLETYQTMDNKDERKHIMTMLEKSIEALGKEKVTVNTK
jgi:uncharacterized secreted protein with C-terminal beta-propeller domain